VQEIAAQNQNIKNPNDLDVFGRKKTKGSKQDSQNKTILSCSTEKRNVVGWGVIMLLGICEWAYFIKVITETRRADNKKFIFIPINSFFF
jgi:hypothetical protein